MLYNHQSVLVYDVRGYRIWIIDQMDWCGSNPTLEGVHDAESQSKLMFRALVRLNNACHVFWAGVPSSILPLIYLCWSRIESFTVKLWTTSSGGT